MSRYLVESDIGGAAIEWLLEIKPYHYKHGEESVVILRKQYWKMYLQIFFNQPINMFLQKYLKK